MDRLANAFVFPFRFIGRSSEGHRKVLVGSRRIARVLEESRTVPERSERSQKAEDRSRRGRWVKILGSCGYIKGAGSLEVALSRFSPFLGGLRPVFFHSRCIREASVRSLHQRSLHWRSWCPDSWRFLMLTGDLSCFLSTLVYAGLCWSLCSNLSWSLIMMLSLFLHLDNIANHVGRLIEFVVDLFGSYVVSAVAAFVVSLIASFGIDNELITIIYPILVSLTGITICFLTTMFVSHIYQIKVARDIISALNKQLAISTVLMTIFTGFISWIALPASITIIFFGVERKVKNWGLFVCVASGLWSNLLISCVTKCYTSCTYCPMQDVQKSGTKITAYITMIDLVLSYRSVIIGIISIALSSLFSFRFVSAYGVCIAFVGFLSTLAVSQFQPFQPRGTTAWAGAFEFGAICAVDTRMTKGSGELVDHKDGVFKFDMISDDWMVLKTGYSDLSDMCVGILLSLFDEKGDDKVSIRMIVDKLERDIKLTRLRQYRLPRRMYASYQCSLILVSRRRASHNEHRTREVVPIIIVRVNCAEIRFEIGRSVGSGSGFSNTPKGLGKAVDYFSSYETVLRHIEEHFTLAAVDDPDTGGHVLIFLAPRESEDLYLSHWRHVVTRVIPVPGLDISELRDRLAR